MSSRGPVDRAAPPVYGRSWVRFLLGTQIFFFVPRSCHFHYYIFITLSPSLRIHHHLFHYHQVYSFINVLSNSLSHSIVTIIKIRSRVYVKKRNQLYHHFFLWGLRQSVILGNDDNYLSTLSNWLHAVAQSKSSDWKRCWRASVDGWASTTFHSHCNNKGPTVTIIRVGKYIFGGYTSTSWSK